MKKKTSWKAQAFPKSWKKDYGTVKAWKKAKGKYIHINKIKSTDRLRHGIYTKGYRYEIASNTFGTSHHKTLGGAVQYAQVLKRRR